MKSLLSVDPSMTLSARYSLINCIVNTHIASLSFQFVTRVFGKLTN